MSCLSCNNPVCICSTPPCVATICTSPLIYLIKDAYLLVGSTSTNLSVFTTLDTICDNAPVTPTSPFEHTLITALTQVLTSGILISNNDFLCCSDCASGLYFLGDLDSTTDLISSQVPSADICCVEHYSSVSTWSTFLQTWILTNSSAPVCCNSDFSELAQQWFTEANSSTAYFYLDALINNGVFEISAFNNHSGLGILFNYLMLNHPELTSDDYLNLLGVLIKLGVVIKCDGCSINISSTTTYLNYTYPV
jgi:hypothetical protein